MDNTQVQIFIDNGATPSILLLSIYNKHRILQKYPKTESYTPIHTGGGMLESHFWIEIPLDRSWITRSSKLKHSFVILNVHMIL